MLLFHAPGPIFSTLVVLLACANPARAVPYPQALEIIQGQNETSLEKRCNNVCGWQNQLCCGPDEYCFTDVYSQAQCGYGATTAAAAGGHWQYYTSTYVETDLVTKTRVYSTFVGVVTVQATTTAYVPVATPICNCPCGPICCADDQYCLTPGQCALYGGQSSVLYYSTTQQGPIFTYSAPLRPTSSAVVVVTATASATTTVPFEAPVATGANVTLTTTQAQTAGGLSPGAIAGIVIGVIAGLLLLTLLLLCLCFRAAWDALVALFGGGGDKEKHRRTREEEVIYERRRPVRPAVVAGGGRRWYGDDRPARVERPPPRKKEDGVGGLAAIGLGLGGLAAALGLKRAYDRRKDEKSEVSSSSYDTSYYTYSSSESDRRTRDDRRSRR